MQRTIMKVLFFDNLGYNMYFKHGLFLMPYRAGLVRAKLIRNEIDCDYLDFGIEIKKELKEIKFNDIDSEKDKIINKIVSYANLEKYNFLIIPINILTLPESNLNEIIHILKIIRNKTKQKIIVGGGIHDEHSLFGYKFADMNIINEIKKYCDYIIVNSDTDAMIDIIKGKKSNNTICDYFSLNLKEYPNTIKNTLFDEECNLDGINLDAYRYNYDEISQSCNVKLKEIKTDLKIGIMPFKFSEGCNSNCAYCAMPRKIDAIPIKPAVDRIERLNNKYGIDNFFFLNNCLNFKKEYLEDFCKELISRNIKIRWSDSIKINNYDKNTYELMKNSGCVRTTFGVESVSDETLKFINKGYTINEIIKSIQFSDEVGMWNMCSFVIGYPHQKEKDIDLLCLFLNKFINNGTINQTTFNIFSVLPNSPMCLEPGKFEIEIDFDKGRFKPQGHSFFTYQYDEKNGKKWKDKLEENQSFKRKINACSKHIAERYKPYKALNDHQSHLIFFLDRYFNDKKKAIRHLSI